jgi:hypothetical protein
MVLGGRVRCTCLAQTGSLHNPQPRHLSLPSERLSQFLAVSFGVYRIFKRLLRPISTLYFPSSPFPLSILETAIQSCHLFDLKSVANTDICLFVAD